MSHNDTLTVLKNGIAAAQAGNRTLARRLLLEATDLDPNSELGWLWLAWLTESTQEAMTYLRRALDANPANEQALARLKQLQAQVSRSAPAWKCPLCQTSFPEQPVVKCPSCGSVFTLNDINALLSNTGVDRNQIRRIIDRYESASKDQADFGTHYNLGLAYLNLKQIDEGIAHLQKAAHIRPDHSVLQDQVRSLLQRQEKVTALKKDQPDEKVSRETVLIVDDSPTICRLVTITLERQGYQVISAADGLEALMKIGEQMPDLILLDITMPRLDGYQLCKIIKGNHETEHIPVVMLSGKDGFFDKVRGRMAGATNYITKPFEPAMLLQVITKHSNRRGSREN